MSNITDWLSIKGYLLNVEVYKEEELTWQQHNEIHRALNLSYYPRTLSFMKKTYSHHPPVMRVLCYLNGELIGHVAIFEDYILKGNKRLKFAGLGMLLSLKPTITLGALLRQMALDLCIKHGYALILARIKNTPQNKERLASSVWCFLDLPLVGKTTRSHARETLALFKSSLTKRYPRSLIAYFKKTGAIKIEGEVF